VVSLRRVLLGTPVCPVCDGPCQHELERSEFRFPDRLPESQDRTADPPPVKAPKPNRRGRRPEHHAPQGPEQDRMVRPEEDR
jgi:hypothetical protein